MNTTNSLTFNNRQCHKHPHKLGLVASASQDVNVEIALQIIDQGIMIDEDSHTGLIRTIKTHHSHKIGAVGTKDSSGYYRINFKINGKLYCVPNHRIVYFLNARNKTDETSDEYYECGASYINDHHIDHVDGCKGNNDPRNLRLVTISENMQNCRGRSKGTFSHINLRASKLTGRISWQVNNNKSKGFPSKTFKATELMKAFAYRDIAHGKPFMPNLKPPAGYLEAMKRSLEEASEALVSMNN